jgi:hypothetical protein
MSLFQFLANTFEMEMKQSKRKRLMKNLPPLHVIHQQSYIVRMMMMVTLTVISMIMIMMQEMVMMICF